MPPQAHLLVTVDAGNECVLLPIMGVLVPFHITTVKAINFSQDGEAQDKVHSYVRVQFNTMPTYDARQSFPTAAFIKELSFRSAKPDAAQKFVQARFPATHARSACHHAPETQPSWLLALAAACVVVCPLGLGSCVEADMSRHVQEAQALRRQVMMKDKEVAERATLVKQEKLQRYQNKAPMRLNDCWVFPPLSARRKLSGTLEAHFNGFRSALPASLLCYLPAGGCPLCDSRTFVCCDAPDAFSVRVTQATRRAGTRCPLVASTWT